MALRPSDVADFVNLTLSNFKTVQWMDLSMEYPQYIASRVISRYKNIERGGPDLRFKLQTKNTGMARHSGLFAQDVTGVEDLTTEGVVNWCKVTGNWSYDIDEPLFQSDRETIVDTLAVREHSCYNDLAKLNEEDLWGSPTSSSDNRPSGIPFWIQKDASTTPAGAFNGGNPSGWTGGAAGISSTTVPAWKNWTFGYSAVTPDDVVAKVKKSLYKTNFEAPHPHPELGFGKADFQIFTVYTVREAMERLAETRNDNLGNDVAKYINNVLIGGVPVDAVHYLDANDISEPLYGVNWRVLRPFVKKGVNMRRTVKDSPRQHTVKEVHYDTWYNWICVNRRELWVGSKA